MNAINQEYVQLININVHQLERVKCYNAYKKYKPDNNRYEFMKEFDARVYRLGLTVMKQYDKR